LARPPTGAGSNGQRVPPARGKRRDGNAKRVGGSTPRSVETGTCCAAVGGVQPLHTQKVRAFIFSPSFVSFLSPSLLLFKRRTSLHIHCARCRPSHLPPLQLPPRPLRSTPRREFRGVIFLRAFSPSQRAPPPALSFLSPPRRAPAAPRPRPRPALMLARRQAPWATALRAWARRCVCVCCAVRGFPGALPPQTSRARPPRRRHRACAAAPRRPWAACNGCGQMRRRS
jgi:hypothetical protein